MPQSEQGPPEKQHYLPVVYLKQFSEDGSTSTRTSRVWFLNGTGQRPVPVETQCYLSFFNSELRAEEAEKFFQESEGLYGEIAKHIWDGNYARCERDYLGLIIFAISLHLRNPAYDLGSNFADRWDAYKLLEQQFAHHVLAGGKGGAPTEVELYAILRGKWVVRLIRTMPGDTLITSDNPSVFYSTSPSGDVHFITLPVVPNCCAFIYDRTIVSDAGARTLNTKDVDLLNGAQLHSMWRALYSHAPFAEELVRDAPEYWSQQKPRRGMIGDDYWEMNVIEYAGHLSFVDLN